MRSLSSSRCQLFMYINTIYDTITSHMFDDRFTLTYWCRILNRIDIAYVNLRFILSDKFQKASLEMLQSLSIRHYYIRWLHINEQDFIQLLLGHYKSTALPLRHSAAKKVQLQHYILFKSNECVVSSIQSYHTFIISGDEERMANGKMARCWTTDTACRQTSNDTEILSAAK